MMFEFKGGIPGYLPPQTHTKHELTQGVMELFTSYKVTAAAGYSV